MLPVLLKNIFHKSTMNLHLPVLCGSSFGRRLTVVSIFGWDLNSFDGSQDRNLKCYKTIKYKISLKFYSLFALEIRNDLFVDLNNLDGCYGRNRRSYTTLEFTSIFFCLKHRKFLLVSWQILVFWAEWENFTEFFCRIDF